MEKPFACAKVKKNKGFVKIFGDNGHKERALKDRD